MKSFDLETRMGMFSANGNRCGIDPTKPATQAHHIKPNTKINRKRWPLFIQSPFNLMPIHHDAHMTKPLPTPPSDLVCDEYEKYLRKLLTKNEKCG